jgi:hypothetical protein
VLAVVPDFLLLDPQPAANTAMARRATAAPLNRLIMGGHHAVVA